MTTAKRTPLSRAAALLARLERLEREQRRAALPSRAVTRAAGGIQTPSDLFAFHADVMSDLATGALSPTEARELTRAVEESLGT